MGDKVSVQVKLKPKPMPTNIKTRKPTGQLLDPNYK